MIRSRILVNMPHDACLFVQLASSWQHLEHCVSMSAKSFGKFLVLLPSRGPLLQGSDIWSLVAAAKAPAVSGEDLFEGMLGTAALVAVLVVGQSTAVQTAWPLCTSIVAETCGISQTASVTVQDSNAMLIPLTVIDWMLQSWAHPRQEYSVAQTCFGAKH